MTVRIRQALATIVVAASIGSGGAVPASARQSDERADDVATELLRKVAEADEAPYRARQVVVYFGGKDQSAAVLDVQSSRSGRFVRAESGDSVTRSWSREGIGGVEGDYLSKHEGDVTQVRVRPEGVVAKYSLAADDPEEILGVKLVPLTLTRRKDDALAERWWVHAKTGVVYRREQFGATGDLVGLATLIEMDWGDPGPFEPVEPDLTGAPQAIQIDAKDAPDRLAGGYELWQTYSLEVDGRAAEQWVYSDGLHALSVFRTRGGLARPEGFTAGDVAGHRVFTGAGPGMWAWEGSGSSFLVVAEEPGIGPAALLEPFPLGGPSVWARLGSVWSRLFRGLAGLFG